MDDQRPFKIVQTKAKLIRKTCEKKKSTKLTHLNKAYKSPFETLKKKSKENYVRRLENFQNDIKKSWDVNKEIIGRAKSTKENFPKRMIVDGQ